MFEKILVALDGSPLPERLLASLEPLLVRPGTQLLVVRAVPGKEPPYDEEHAAAERYIRAIEKRLAAQGLEAEGHVLVGLDPAAAIVSYAAQQGVSLLAAGTHGRTGLQRLVLGSVAEEIVRTASCPVLLANPWVPRAPLQFKKVLLPLDGSDRSEEILGPARDLARRFGSELVLAHVEDRSVLAAHPVVADEHALTVRTFERAKRALAGVRTSTTVKVGFPALELVDAILETSPDVVLLTTHGRTGLARVALGSVAESVLRRSPVPVLVKRSVLAPARHSPLPAEPTAAPTA